MFSPADKRRHLVFVIQPLSCPRNKPGQVAAGGGGVCLSNPPTSTLPSALPGVSSQASRPPPPQAPPSTDTDKDPHNEVERRRKLRISRNIKTLAETLTPPCHCGKTTRADVLTRVVEQIKELQKKNSELQAKIEELQKPTNGEELSRQAIELIEENLRLRSLLLSSVGHKESQSLGSGNESQIVETSEELKDGTATTGKEESECEAPPAPSSSSSSSQADRESTGEKENEDVQEEETSNASKEDGARGSATEQPWPISSLLSDESRPGPREHNLPILSPTYIAEHCSTSSCETHFFPPVSSPPITSVSSRVGTSTSGPLSSHTPPATKTLTVISTGSIPSTSSRPLPSVSHTALYPPHPTPPYPSPTTTQSIVQPWIGSPTSRNESAAIHGSVTIQQSQPLQATVQEAGRPPVHHVRLHGYQRSVASMVHCTNHQQPMYTPRQTHSARPRGGLHTHTPQYTSTGEHYTADDSTTARLYSSHTQRDLTQGRAHCTENLSPYFSTGSTFQLCAGSVNPAVLLQAPSFSNVSTDHYFHHSVQPVHNLPSLQSHHQLHTQHNLHSHPSSHNIGHHPHPHHHNYPLPPHPHHPIPSFTPHPHHPPSHHGTVWRPYSDRQRTATRFSLSNILSPSLTSSPPLGLPTPISPSVHQSQGGRIPSFFVDHLLDDL